MMPSRFKLDRAQDQEPVMNTDLRNFVRPLAQVIAATLFAVFTVAFVTVPYTLGTHPGDPHAAQQGAPRHMS
jgi:hypothetical protein